MVAYFETLADLSNGLNGRGIEVVDPPVDLLNWDDQWEYGPAWRNQPSVRKVVGFIARNVASTPLHVFEFDAQYDRQRIRTGELAQLLRRPSRAPAMTAMRFWERILIDGLLHDKWCAQIVEHVDGFELVRIPASRVKFDGDWLGRIQTVKITQKDGSTLERDPKDFILDVGYSERGTNGTSPLRTLQAILDESREAVAYRRSIWKNGARVPMVIERPKEAGKFEEGAFTRFRNSWSRFVRGGGEEGGTPILEDGMQLKEVTAFRPKDTLDLEGRKLTDIEVCSAYYIAPELIGAREGTFSNIKAFKDMLYGPNLGPYFTAWEQALNASLPPLLSPGDEVYIEANIESKMRGSFEEQIDYISTAVGAPVLTRNEARGRLNLKRIDGGDDLVTPLNVLIGGQASPQDGETAGGGGAPLGTPSGVRTADEIAKLVTSAGTLIRAGFEPQAALAAVGLDPIEHLGLLPVTIREDEQKAAGVIQTFLARQRQVIASQKNGNWDRGRWDRELTTDLAKAGVEITEAAQLARFTNNATERELLAEGSAS